MTTLQVNVLEAKNRLSELLRRAADGDDVVIATRGVPTARLVAIDPRDDRPAISRWLETHPLPRAARRTPDDIDASVNAERAAWD